MTSMQFPLLPRHAMEVDGVGSRKPVRAGNVETDRYRNSLGAETGTSPNYTEQPERRNEFAKELTAAGADVMREL